jgi:putative membrane-bound dehydrogenase-like protein
MVNWPTRLPMSGRMIRPGLIATLLLVWGGGPTGMAEDRAYTRCDPAPFYVDFSPAATPRDGDLDPRSPEAALRTIRVAEGFRVELMASEPLVRDPIALDWGTDGKLWVVEMGDYPLGLDGKGSPGGSIKILEDQDGDGRYDRSTVFLGGLGFPTGVMPWRNGVLISRAPDILFAEDLDGDNRADRIEVLFTGFVPGNPQHRVNGFEVGLDGLVYGANGDSGGTIRSPGSAESVSIRGRDFRFGPDTRRFETVSGQAQFGRHRDDWGRWFGNNNSAWAWHYVLPEDALRRNPSLAIGSPLQRLDPDPRLHPDSQTLPRFNNPGSANKVTSANSATPYRDELFGPDHASSLFVSEPVHNLVRRMVLSPTGPTFRGKPVHDAEGREFLASSDPWFRPTMLRTGPDGCLWVADMYREVIEHPEWIPDDVESKLDLRAGSDRGRIYRVVPVHASPRPIPRLDRLDTPGLVAALESPNGWHRDSAQRLLAHRRDPAALEPLRLAARTSSRPKTRVQALWTLRNLGGLDPDSILLALQDAHPQVRRVGIEVARADHRFDGRIFEVLLSLVDDSDPEIQFALAIALGDSSDPRAGRALARLAIRAGDDPWSRVAVLSSAVPHSSAILAGLFEGAGPEGPPKGWVEPLFALAASRPGEGGLRPLLDAVGKPGASGFARWQFSAAAGLAEEADRNRSPELSAAIGRWGDLISAARGLADDDRVEEDRRIEATRILGRAEGDRAFLAQLLRPQVPARLQLVAIRSMARTDDRRVAEILLGGWNGHPPDLRGAILDTLLGRPSWTAAMLSSMEDQCVPPGEIPPAIRRRLLEQPDPNLKARALAIFERSTSSTRREVLDAYRPALATPGDPKAGAVTFRRACAGCHRLEGNGTEVGPDLTTLSDVSPEALVVAILDPNRAYEVKYMDYTVQSRDGRVFSGLIAGESANAITLRRQDGREDVLLRSEIETVSASGRSLMPEGMEKELTPRDLADLAAYLGSIRNASKSGVTPR